MAIALRRGGYGFGVVLGVLLGLAPRSAFGDYSDPDFSDLPYEAGFDASVPEAGDQTQAKLAYVVQRAGTLTGGSGRTLLPFGTVLDSASIDDAQIGHIRLTVPLDSGFSGVTELQAATLDSLLGRHLAGARPLAGLKVSIRVAGEAYRSLGEWLPAPLPVEPDVGPALSPAVPGKNETTFDPRAVGGPLANADGQPAGALSGVVVYCNAGHGWTAGSSNWYLQRPLLHNMVEDYGNLEQLNYFVNYLYNAGATVVPFRPVGYQNHEVVLDNDDAGVTYTGAWLNDTSTSKYYENGINNSGVRYRYATTGGATTATARYTPNIPTADFYPVYCWTPTPDNRQRVRQTYRVVHSGGTALVPVDHRIVGNGWIWLGSYYFQAGSSGYVEIINQSPDSGVVLADAIRFGNGIGDIVAAGRLSGYPRDEEAGLYWAHSELRLNARGFSSSIWDCCSTDGDDNVGVGARWAREMNRLSRNAQGQEDKQAERWRRVYMEFHSNAAGGTAKGAVALYNYSTATTNQFTYATIVGEKLEADMLALQHLFDYDWGIRNPNTFGGTYGAIGTNYNSDEFDATILEVAFHDNAEDAANLLDAKVRDAVSRSTMQGIITFLHGLANSPIPLVFLPDPPEGVSAVHDGVGNIVVSWTPGPARPDDPASGDPATGYRIYRSSNGYGFGQAVTVGNVTSATLTGIPPETTVYLRVAAFNAGGESMPSATIAVRRPTTGNASILLVDGFDRVSRQQNYIQMLPAGPMQRPIARRVNSFDYVVQHGRSITAAGRTFDSCTNEAVTSGRVQLAAYEGVVWILGEESTVDRTFDTNEQNMIAAYLSSGGGFFATGSEIGYELDGQGAGRVFYESVLRADYQSDSAGTYTVSGSGGILADMGSFSFDPAQGAAYPVEAADRILPRAGASAILSYSGGLGGTAGVQYDSGIYRTVIFGFPFETIASASVRDAIMARVLEFIAPGGCPFSADVIASFEGVTPGFPAVFQNPRFSSSTVHHLAATPNACLVSTDAPVYGGTGSIKVQWGFVDSGTSRWLRLTTFDGAVVPNPVIDLRRPVRLQVRFEGPVGAALRVSLGVRETGVDAALGENGGTAGTIEWLGATAVADGAPQGVLITAQPGGWQTLTFLRRPGEVQPFTGDGHLIAPFDKGVLEHLAFSAVNSAGPFTVYIDAIEQPCPRQADLDGDGDVDMSDFGRFQACLTGTGSPQTDPACQGARMDIDSDVDQNDFVLFQACLSGEGLPADPDCGS
jgi:hypothetical protein